MQMNAKNYTRACFSLSLSFFSQNKINIFIVLLQPQSLKKKKQRKKCKLVYKYYLQTINLPVKNLFCDETTVKAHIKYIGRIFIKYFLFT